jgi:chemotaxis protein CheX
MKIANAAYFSESVQNVFKTMLNQPVTCAPPKVLSEGSPTLDVTGVITFGGDVVGAAVLSFPAATAQALVKDFAMVEGDLHDPEVLDAIGELANMFAGGAKARYNGLDAMISIPTVVCGSKHHLNRQQKAPWVVVGCNCEHGRFLAAMSLIEKKL